MVNLYQSDVRALSDAELETLSAEMEEAYQRSGEEEGYWLDDDAETRYWEMHAEMNRRYCLEHPEWKPPPLSEVTALCLRVLGENFVLAREVRQRFDAEFSGKVGDTYRVARHFRVILE